MAEESRTILEKQHANDPDLSNSSKRGLLVPGWAGELSPDEFAFVKSELRKSPSLKRRWGFRPTAKRLNENQIRVVAQYGLSAIEKPVSASLARNEKVRKY
jgi:hypothetical protein